jgi:hypothetical protein
MPTYNFRNTQTNDEWTDMMSITAKEEFLSANPHIQQVLTPIALSTSTGGIKTDAGWRDVLKRIKKANRGSTIDSGNLSQI